MSNTNTVLKNDELNKEFDDMRLKATWNLEEILEVKEKFRPIFLTDEGFDKAMALIETMVHDLNKNI